MCPMIKDMHAFMYGSNTKYLSSCSASIFKLWNAMNPFDYVSICVSSTHA